MRVQPQQQRPAPLFHIAERNLRLKIAERRESCGSLRGICRRLVGRRDRRRAGRACIRGKVGDEVRGGVRVTALPLRGRGQHERQPTAASAGAPSDLPRAASRSAASSRPMSE